RGLEAMKQQRLEDAAKHFLTAIDLDRSNPPGHLNLGDVRLQQGDRAGALASWDRLIEVSPDRAYLAFDRLERLHAASGASHKFADRCRQNIASKPHEKRRVWRHR